MVFRYYISCLTCGTPHTLRISVGHNSYQDHSFSCANCDEGIRIRLEVNFEAITTELKYLENCQLGDKEGVIVNLNPEFPVPQDQLHQDGIFPWLNFVHDHFSLNDDSDARQVFEKSMVDVHMALGGVFNILEGWECLKKAWSLANNGKEELARKHLEKYESKSSYEGNINLPSMLFHFSCSLVYPGKWLLFESTAEEICRIHKNDPLKFNGFRNYFKEELCLEHREKYFETYSNYFKNFNEYNQVLLYSKNNKPIDESFHVSSVDFKNTKMFYGDAFEVLTVSFTTLACLNNLAKGRDFDKFEKMSLKKYMTIDKANRANPFLDSMPFNNFAKCIDSQVRNASHHHSMKIDKKGIVYYRSPGSANWKTIPYIKYLYLCNEIMLTLCTLHLIELVLAFEE